ncbi:MAG: hypothetical protein EON88_13935 [Brevundimonas sp.]|nr:MAG: hypothetical protein EON88_13935 [Brevundimonas sp.]
MAKTIRIAAFGAAMLLAAPAFAQDGATADLVRCRATADDAARLACYDAAVTAFETARAQGEVVVLSRSEVAETQRRSFGFDLNVLNPFNSDGQPEELASVDGTLARARQAGGKWTVVLQDGSTWKQLDNATPYFRTAVGTPVTIRRATLGSYLMSIGGAAPLRVRRENP